MFGNSSAAQKARTSPFGKPTNLFANNPTQPQTPNNSPQIQNLTNHFQSELAKRDQKINNLEFQVKSLRNTVNLCVTLINELKMSEIKTNELPIKKPVFELKKQTMAIDLFKNILQDKSLNDQENIYFGRQNYKLVLNKAQPSKKVTNLKIENSFGSVVFRDPVDLNNIKNIGNVHEWVQISNHNIGVNEQELKKKKCEVLISDFKGYKAATISQKQAIVDTVTNLQNQSNFYDIRFDYETGSLNLACQGF